MSKNNADFKLEIKDLRIAVERVLETLKKFETTGTAQDANSALWAISSVWNGKEYSAIETALKENGYKSSLEMGKGD